MLHCLARLHAGIDSSLYLKPSHLGTRCALSHGLQNLHRHNTQLPTSSPITTSHQYHLPQTLHPTQINMSANPDTPYGQCTFTPTDVARSVFCSGQTGTTDYKYSDSETCTIVVGNSFDECIAKIQNILSKLHYGSICKLCNLKVDDLGYYTFRSVQKGRSKNYNWLFCKECTTHNQDRFNENNQQFKCQVIATVCCRRVPEDEEQYQMEVIELFPHNCKQEHVTMKSRFSEEGWTKLTIDQSVIGNTFADTLDTIASLTQEKLGNVKNWKEENGMYVFISISHV